MEGGGGLRAGASPLPLACNRQALKIKITWHLEGTSSLVVSELQNRSEAYGSEEAGNNCMRHGVGHTVRKRGWKYGMA